MVCVCTCVCVCVYIVCVHVCVYILVWGLSISITVILLAEDKKIIRIVLVKSDRSAASCWKSLLQDQYNSDAFTFNEMEKKLTLERFQREVWCQHFASSQICTLLINCSAFLQNPGFDFSGAEISGNYSGGGPKF